MAASAAETASTGSPAVSVDHRESAASLPAESRGRAQRDEMFRHRRRGGGRLDAKLGARERRRYHLRREHGEDHEPEPPRFRRERIRGRRQHVTPDRARAGRAGKTQRRGDERHARDGLAQRGAEQSGRVSREVRGEHAAGGQDHPGFAIEGVFVVFGGFFFGGVFGVVERERCDRRRHRRGRSRIRPHSGVRTLVAAFVVERERDASLYGARGDATGARLEQFGVDDGSQPAPAKDRQPLAVFSPRALGERSGLAAKHRGEEFHLRVVQFARRAEGFGIVGVDELCGSERVAKRVVVFESRPSATNEFRARRSDPRGARVRGSGR